MSKAIETNTLRDWLESHQPVTVLDVRSDEDRAQWAIPGSLHINAYEALRAGEPGVLASAILPHDRPVVTVCNAGRISQTAAAILADRGFDARSLVGGMKAWSLAWNTADIPLVDPTVRVIQVRRTGDTLFTNGVGRPDLHANPEAARERARALFHSLLRLRGLPSTMLVLPAHASEPIAFDGQPVAASLGDVAGWLSAWLASESGFVERVTSKLPPTPPNFVRIVELNESGDVPDIDPTDLEAGANRCAVR